MFLLIVHWCLSPPPNNHTVEHDDDDELYSNGTSSSSSKLSEDDSTLMMASSPIHKHTTSTRSNTSIGSSPTGLFQESAALAAAATSARSLTTANEATNEAVWTEMYDETHQLPYYQHHDGTSQWEMPTGFVSHWGEHGYSSTAVVDGGEVGGEEVGYDGTEDNTQRSATEDTDHWSNRYNENWENEDEFNDPFTVPPPPVMGPGEEENNGGVSRSYSM